MQCPCLSDNKLGKEASHEVAKSFRRVFDDQVDHALPNGSACGIGTTKCVDSRLSSYLRHDRTTIFALDVTERHLRALVLVDLELRVVEIRDLVDRHCFALAAAMTWRTWTTYFSPEQSSASLARPCRLSFAQVQGDGLGSLSCVAQRCDLR